MKHLKTAKVKEYMTTDLITVTTETVVSDIYALFKTHNIHHIPVVNDTHNAKGIISRQDVNILLDWGTQLGLKSAEIKNNKMLSTLMASDIMQENVYSVDPDFSLAQVAQIFLTNQFHGLPVTENGRLVGIITTYDLIEAAYS